MLDRNRTKLMFAMFLAVSIFLTLFAVNPVSASGGSISMANVYPEDEGTYSAIDHILYQTTAVNTNTTVSVSIDDGQPIPMAFQGIRNEVVNGDTGAQDWYTWQVTIPPITASGRHSFQFFSHYYVWQDTDQYWAEFNSRSTAYSFTIADYLTPTSNRIPTRTVPEFPTWIILPFFTVATLISIVLAICLALACRGYYCVEAEISYSNYVGVNSQG